MSGGFGTYEEAVGSLFCRGKAYELLVQLRLCDLQQLVTRHLMRLEVISACCSRCARRGRGCCEPARRRAACDPEQVVSVRRWHSCYAAARGTDALHRLTRSFLPRQVCEALVRLPRGDPATAARHRLPPHLTQVAPAAAGVRGAGAAPARRPGDRRAARGHRGRHAQVVRVRRVQKELPRVHRGLAAQPGLGGRRADGVARAGALPRRTALPHAVLPHLRVLEPGAQHGRQLGAAARRGLRAPQQPGLRGRCAAAPAARDPGRPRDQDERAARGAPRTPAARACTQCAECGRHCVQCHMRVHAPRVPLGTAATAHAPWM